MRLVGRHLRPFVLGLLLAVPAPAEMRRPDETLSAGEGAGPISDVSRPVGDGLSVHDGARTIGESSSGSVRSSGPVRDSRTRSMLSGPMSESSVGSMTHSRGLTGGGSVTEASAGAVKHDVAAPLGERISQPLRELGPLQARLRELRTRPLDDVLIDDGLIDDAEAMPPADVEVELDVELEPAEAEVADTDDLPVYDGSALLEAADAEVDAELEPSETGDEAP